MAVEEREVLLSYFVPLSHACTQQDVIFLHMDADDSHTSVVEGMTNVCMNQKAIL